MHTLSLLSQKVSETFLQTARQHLEQHGSLSAVLFITLASGKRIEIPLHLPATTTAREAYFAGLGSMLANLKLVIAEAVLLTEGWIVNVQQAPASLKVPPSQHPSRQAAITLIGRNAADTRHTCVIHAFERKPAGQLIWAKSMIALYDEPVKPSNKAVGLLDYLFIGQKQR